MRLTISGTHQGKFQGISPTGKKVTFSSFNLYRFEEGKLAEFWQLIDVANFLRQIGGLTI
jgi:predicted ester cyclase